MYRLLRRTCILIYQVKVWSNTLFCQPTLYSPCFVNFTPQSQLRFGVWSIHVDSGQGSASAVRRLTYDSCHGVNWIVLGGEPRVIIKNKLVKLLKF